MNQYLIAIYMGKLSKHNLNELMKSYSLLSGNSINTISISSPDTLTLLVVEEKTELTTGLTDQYFLLTKELQKLDHQDKFYFVYDYRNRKIIENPMQKCFSLMKINISCAKLHSIIQTVKDIKQDVFAGFNIQYLEDTEFLTIEVLLSSPLLETIYVGGNLPAFSKRDNHYLYLRELSELLSDPKLCNSVQARAIPEKLELKQQYIKR